MKSKLVKFLAACIAAAMIMPTAVCMAEENDEMIAAGENLIEAESEETQDSDIETEIIYVYLQNSSNEGSSFLVATILDSLVDADGNKIEVIVDEETANMSVDFSNGFAEIPVITIVGQKFESSIVH